MLITRLVPGLQICGQASGLLDDAVRPARQAYGPLKHRRKLVPQSPGQVMPVIKSWSVGVMRTEVCSLCLRTWTQEVSLSVLTCIVIWFRGAGYTSPLITKIIATLIMIVTWK